MIFGGFEIRKVVLSFSSVIAFMLYQTAGSSVGSIVAIVTLVLTAFCYTLEKESIADDFEKNTKALLLAFIFVLFLSTYVNSLVAVSSVFKFLLQAVICVLLLGVSITPVEHRYIKIVIQFASVIYSYFIIRYCLSAGAARYIHGDIEMFGSSFDPNYIGIPLVASCALLLDDFLNSDGWLKKVLVSSAWLVVVFAIIQTSSRGNSISLVLVSGLVFLNFLRSTSVSLKKYLIVLVLIIGILFLYLKASDMFGDNIARMTEFEEDSDNGRFELWKHSLSLWYNNFLFGTGLGGVAILTGGHCSHNTFMQLLSETGIVGFVLFVAFLVKILRKAYEYDKVTFFVILTMLFQICFLNALDNRCVWALLGWAAMIPNKNNSNFESINRKRE